MRIEEHQTGTLEERTELQPLRCTPLLLLQTSNLLSQTHIIGQPRQSTFWLSKFTLQSLKGLSGLIRWLDSQEAEPQV